MIECNTKHLIARSAGFFTDNLFPPEIRFSDALGDKLSDDYSIILAPLHKSISPSPPIGGMGYPQLII